MLPSNLKLKKNITEQHPSVFARSHFMKCAHATPLNSKRAMFKHRAHREVMANAGNLLPRGGRRGDYGSYCFSEMSTVHQQFLDLMMQGNGC